MTPTKGTLRTCHRGHRYRKSSECPTCPVCEKEARPDNGFLAELSAPARRALESAGIVTLSDLASYSEPEILKLHGIGPASMPTLRNALTAEGLSFGGPRDGRK